MCERLIGNSTAREARERGGSSETEGVWGAGGLESLAPPRVETEIEGGRSGRALPVPFSDSSRFRARSVDRPLVTTPAPRSSPGSSLFTTSSVGCSLFRLRDSFVAVLTSGMLRLAGLDNFPSSTVEPYMPFLSETLVIVDEDAPFRLSCAIDWAEFCRARDGCALWIIRGGELLRWRSLLTAKVPAIGEDAVKGELAAELFVLALWKRGD